GEIHLTKLGAAGEAQARLAAAMEADPSSRRALLGMARLAEEKGDHGAARQMLAKLVSVAEGPAEEAAIYDRLASACERAGDLEQATLAVAAARRAAPS